MNERIKNKSLPLDGEAVLAFFQERGQRYSEENPYTSVLYQDQQPELAKQRDLFEKSLILSKLNLNRKMKVLDVGCGIGRWADEIAPLVYSYTGVDISPNLIEIAKKRAKSSNVSFLVLGADQLDNLRDDKFDLVIMAGLLIYLNDDVAVKCLQNIATVTTANGRLYMREPMALAERLTLRDYWSDDLQQNYSAIYRTTEQFDDLFAKSLYQDGYEEIELLPLYDDDLNTRKETMQYYCIVDRGAKP